MVVIRDLEGNRLNIAVHKALGFDVQHSHIPYGPTNVNGVMIESQTISHSIPDYSGDWSIGCEIIADEFIGVSHDGTWWEACYKGDVAKRNWSRGKTLLIAAMRSFAVSRLGDTVAL